MKIFLVGTPPESRTKKMIDLNCNQLLFSYFAIIDIHSSFDMDKAFLVAIKEKVKRKCTDQE